MNPVAENNDRAWGEVLAAEPYVEAALARTYGSVPPEQRAQMIRDAEIKLIDGWQRGETAWPESPAAWLVRAAGRRACDDAKKAKRRATDPAGAAGADFEPGAAPAADAELERMLAEENALGLYALLSPTQRQIAVLRFGADLEPRAIAKQLKLSRRAVYRHLDAMTSRLQRPAAELVDGEFPKAWGELVSGHVAGTLSPRDQVRATALLEANSDAQLFALGLQRAGEQLAALVPPAALLVAPENRAPFARMADRVGDLAMGVRDAIENAAATAKHQMANLVNRTVDAAPAIASSRSGAGALLASCVIASGGTVCVITGTTPGEFGDIFGQQKKPQIARKAIKRKPARKLVTATARPTQAPRQKPRSKPRTAPTPAPTPAPTLTAAPNQPSPSPAPSTATGDFGAQPEAAAQPAPAPIDGPGPFARP